MSDNTITLLKTRFDSHVSSNTIKEFEEAITNAFHCEEVLQQPFRKVLVNVYRLSDKIKFFRKIFDKLFSFISTDKNYFIVLMGIQQIRKAYPYFLFTAKSKSVYLFDCWEKYFERTEELIKRHNIKTIFFSAKQSAEHFQKIFTDHKCIWLPEAIKADNYIALPYEKKDIDIIQIGRRYDWYHKNIIGFCEQEKINYLYEKTKGEIIFSDKNEFYKGLGRSKISICFSYNITHPVQRGNTSTMTQRYLQSMASKCLIIGNLPYDMKELFDYNPIIEFDMNNPTNQLKEVLLNYKNYLPLIEKNYLEVISKHQWINRLEILKF